MQQHKSFVRHFSLIILSLISLQASANADQLSSASINPINLQKYAGKWYELASDPTIFQRGCRCTTAEYALREDFMQIKNACLKDKNRLVIKKGKAMPVANSANSKFKLQFYWPFKHDYWIYYVAPDYKTALVGTPDKDNLWLLARKPTVSTAEFDALKQRASQLGFDVHKLQKTEQDCTT